MEEKIGAICWGEKGEERQLTFQEILLDETLLDGEIWVRRDVLAEAGGKNENLFAKANYELLLRIAQKAQVWQASPEKAEKAGKMREDEWLHLHKEAAGGTLEAYKTDCYILSRYKKELQESGWFEAALTGMAEELAQSKGAERRDKERCMEAMLAQDEPYWEIYDATQPVLIYMGGEICYAVLDTFAKNLGDAFTRLGKKVECFNTDEHDFRDIAGYLGKRFFAVIGMQTYLFSAKLTDGTFAHDKIIGPKYHYVFDHPIWLRNHLEQTAQNLCVLTPDGNYAAFAKKYYGLEAAFLPPAGIEKYSDMEKEYGISFLGSDGIGFSGMLGQMLACDRATRILWNHFIRKIRRHLNEPPEKLFEETLEELQINVSKEQFKELFYRSKWIFNAMAQRYRRAIIERLLEAGIEVHVFGKSWETCPLRSNPNLICHEAVLGEEGLKVYGKSRLALNVMTWHKDGFTERIANAMLQKAVVVTDRTDYLETHFVNGRDMIIFSLEEIDKVPQMVQMLLEKEDMRKKIAENAYRIAQKEYTWTAHMRKFLQLRNNYKNCQKNDDI